MSQPLIGTSRHGHLLQVQMNRADKLNALNREMYQGLADALDAAAADPQVRTVLLSGADRAFCSGNDIADFVKGEPVSPEHPLPRFMYGIANFPKPIVAAVRGPAIGIGVTMLLHCDPIYAAESARFQLPFVNIGICPELGSTLMLPAMLGHPRAAELLLLGESFTAAQAREAGIVNAVLPDGELLAHAEAQANKLAAQPPHALRTSKALLKRWTREQLQGVIAAEINSFVPLLKMPEAVEALEAFMQKRKPDFSKFS